MNNLHLAAAPGPGLWFLSTHDHAYNAQDGTMRIVRKDVVSGPATQAEVDAALCEALAADQSSLTAVVAERDRLRAVADAAREHRAADRAHAAVAAAHPIDQAAFDAATETWRVTRDALDAALATVASPYAV